MEKNLWQKLEQLIFGSKKNKGVLRIIIKKKSIKKTTWTDFKRDQNLKAPYLFYPMRLQDNEEIEIFKSGKFTIMFILDEILFNNLTGETNRQDFTSLEFAIDEIRKIIVFTFWCLIHLGAIGTRSRRGAGKIGVVGYERFNQHLIQPTDDLEHHNYIKTCLTKIKHFFEKQNYTPRVHDGANSADNNNRTAIPKLDGWPFRLWIYKGMDFENYEDALKCCNHIYKDFRNKELHNLEDERVYLGLPVTSKKKDQLKRTYWQQHPDKQLHRRSSPLFLGVNYCKGKYYPYLGIFYSQFFYPGGKLIYQIEENNKTKTGKKNKKPYPVHGSGNHKLRTVYHALCDFMNKNQNWEKIILG